MHLDNGFPVFILVRTLFERSVMPRVNRREIFSETDVQVFHTISRCVRRNHLCGRDRRSGRDYSHRREWIRSRLEKLAGIFVGLWVPSILAFGVIFLSWTDRG